MSLESIGRAFEEGVKAALKFFQGDGGPKALAKGGETVRKNMSKVAKAAKQVSK